MADPTATQTNRVLPSGTRATHPSEAQIAVMAQSISGIGILEPLVVTRAGNLFRLVEGGGEVRWLAAKKLGIDIVPIRIVGFDGQTAAAASLIHGMALEPLSREDILTSLESLISCYGADALELVVKQFPSLQGVPNSPQEQERINALEAWLNSQQCDHPQ